MVQLNISNQQGAIHMKKKMIWTKLKLMNYINTLQKNIPIKKHRATRLEKTDYTLYDYFICMEQSNINNALRIFETDPNKKLIRLLDLTNMSKDIADPWHTGDFDMTYKEIEIGINEFIKQYLKK